MDIFEAIERRHAVRRYCPRPIEKATRDALNAEIAACNSEGSLNIQLITGEPQAFDSFLAHYGKFRNVENYLALVGTDAADLNERAGYYGERIVLAATALGLDSCWVALTFSKRKSCHTIGKDERLVCVIALGYGETHGIAHKSKPLEKLCAGSGNAPAWFRRGMEAALLAPTAINQQRFCITLLGPNRARAEATGGPYADVDLGIVKYHFEAGAGTSNFTWA